MCDRFFSQSQIFKILIISNLLDLGKLYNIGFAKKM
ncbi:hypothetical protein MUK42_25729 [Musa troglodytarum]|uniref:Uncharacterized protein n=1 Tax=Musa troglodytarum TaxID=320322 RepID=A0A9E7F4G9_9LILI|nr:hypothetical protein MUK42_25729 [Musa troglodytarum]